MNIDKLENGEKMNIDELTIEEIKQLQCLLKDSTQPENCYEQELGVRIVILQRGWVVVGRYSKNKEYCTVRNGYVIRRWGTTEGLPELAIKGPLSETKLEPSPKITFHGLTEIASIECEESKWKKHCPV